MRLLGTAAPPHERSGVDTRGKATIRLTEHCVERYQQRFRPALDIEAARTDLARLLDVADVVADPPRWLAERAEQWAPAYALIGDDCVLPLVPAEGRSGMLSAVTCLGRGGISDAARAYRSQRRRSRRR